MSSSVDLHTGRAANISFENVEIEYGSGAKRFRAVEGLSLEIEDGEFIAVVGPSGCGKSTILRVLAGLLRPSAGLVKIGTHEVQGPRRDIGVVFQDPTLLPWKTVIENVLLPAKIMRLDPVESKQNALSLLELVRLTGFEGFYPEQLSGGMRQRVGIARGLLHDPKVLLMDEPFGALDAMTRETMNVEIQRIWLKTKKTVFFITHSIPEAVLLADRIIVLSPRPARLLEVVQCPSVRPRTPSMLAEPAFAKISAHLRALFGIETGLD